MEGGCLCLLLYCSIRGHHQKPISRKQSSSDYAQKNVRNIRRNVLSAPDAALPTGVLHSPWGQKCKVSSSPLKPEYSYGALTDSFAKEADSGEKIQSPQMLNSHRFRVYKKLGRHNERRPIFKYNSTQLE